MRFFAAILGALALSACAAVPGGHGPGTAPPSPPEAQLPPRISRGPDVASLAISEAQADRALRSFVESCPKLLAREDDSELTRAEDWRGVCEAATTIAPGNALAFFRDRFETVRIADGKAFLTGYYEPEIRGSRERRVGYDQPVFAMPGDLIRDPNWTGDGRAPLGKMTADGFKPYDDRAEIVAGSLLPSNTPLVYRDGVDYPPPAADGRAPVIAWAADPVEFFFLQIQGSGLLRLPDGGIMRIGYAGQNGRGYTAIGAVMREQGLLGDGPGQYPGSMQGLMQYIREHPVEGAALMNRNQSWIFFREVVGDGPYGALNVPVRARASVAADPAFTPLGAPVWLDVDRAEADGLWIAQDTGGAIKGANRFDTFWGNGEDARRIAGGMTARGDALVLLPKGVPARLLTQ
ncbi:murein transglycosylase A [Qipengyuania sp.]|uniref:murein transglycosylase A n=1 Tax=Qipengyuania sp. TaxID=2004515 RepID=UPI0035C7AD2F